MVVDAFRTGRGVAWGAHDPGVFTGCERFFRPGYVANLVSSWIPAVPGLADRLDRRASRRRRRLRARRVDPHPRRDLPGVDGDRVRPAPGSRSSCARAGQASAAVTFAAARPRTSRAPATGWCTTFDCLHDMGDPVAAARHIRGRARRGRRLADRRAVRRRHGGGEPDPGRPGLLLLLDVPVRAARHLGGRRDALGNQAARRRSASSRRPGSVRSVGSRRPRSTWCTRPARDRWPWTGRRSRGPTGWARS